MSISIDSSYCKGCEICVHACPKRVFTMSKERNQYGTLIPCIVEEERCIGCRLCEIMCPDGCINVEMEDLK